MNSFNKIISIIISVTMVFSLGVYNSFASDGIESDLADNKIQNQIENSYKTDFDDYYCIKTSYDKNSISEYEKIHKEQEPRISKELEIGGTICSAVNYEYLVYEKYDSVGNVLDSHILTNKDVFEFETKKLLNNSNKLNSKSATSNGLLGSDFETKGKLQIGIVVIKNAYGKYHILSNADWDTNSKIGGKNYPDAAGDDFFAVTWGGNGELSGTITSVSAWYQSKNNIKVSKAKSDKYKGYCWQFLEKNGGVGSCMQALRTELDLKKTYTKKKNKKTNIKCTYIHTYSKVNGSISFNGGTNGAACGVSLSKTDSKWQIQCDVAGLEY